MRTLVTVLLAVSLLSGCASKYGTGHTHVEYYPACYRPIHQLRQAERDVSNTTLGGGVVGALGGALLGFLSTGKVEGAVIGGVAGAATGAVAGNIYAKQNKIRDENRRMAMYLEEIDGDISRLDIVSASATTMLNCYDRAFQDLLDDIRDRAIPRYEAEERFDEIAHGRDEAIALLGEAITHGRDLEMQYDDAFRREERAMEQRARPSRRTTEPLSAAKKKKRDFKSKLDAMHRQKREAQARSDRNQRDFSTRLDEIDA